MVVTDSNLHSHCNDCRYSIHFAIVSALDDCIHVRLACNNSNSALGWDDDENVNSCGFVILFSDIRCRRASNTLQLTAARPVVNRIRPWSRCRLPRQSWSTYGVQRRLTNSLCSRTLTSPSHSDSLQKLNGQISRSVDPHGWKIKFKVKLFLFGTI